MAIWSNPSRPDLPALASELSANGRDGRDHYEADAGERVGEIAFLLGHRDANVTRALYVREHADTRRHSMRRSRMLSEFSEILKP